MQEPSDLIENNKRLINDEITTQVNEQMEQKESENVLLKAQNSELLQKLQAITNEFAVVKSDAEIVKQKARQMLIDKDQELERMRGNKNNASPSPHKDGAQESAARDNNQPDSGASTFQEGTTLMPQSIMEADNSSSMMDQSNTSQEVSNKILSSLTRMMIYSCHVALMLTM